MFCAERFSAQYDNPYRRAFAEGLERGYPYGEAIAISLWEVPAPAKTAKNIAAGAKGAKNAEKIGEINRASKIRFPENPNDFNPEGLKKIGPFETKNGKIIKWIDKNKKAIYEWDEDIKHGAHYHVIGKDGNSRLSNGKGETHFYPGDFFEP